MSVKAAIQRAVGCSVMAGRAHECEGGLALQSKLDSDYGSTCGEGSGIDEATGLDGFYVLEAMRSTDVLLAGGDGTTNS